MTKIILDTDLDLNEVLEFAKEKHKGQKRDDGRDYIIHPMRVAKIVDDYKGKNSSNRKVLFAAALLHDTLEDTYTSYRELVENFGEYVASLVLELTTAKYACNYIGKAQYLEEKMEHMTSYALTIKLADRLDNLTDMAGCKPEKQQKMINDTIYILSHLEKNRELTKSQQELSKAIKKEINLFFEKQEIKNKSKELETKDAYKK